MSDELRVNITTEADTSGAEQAALALQGVEAQSKAAGAGAERGALGLDRLRDVARGAGWQIPILGRAIQGLMNPVAGLTSLVAGGVAALVQYARGLADASAESARAARELEVLEAAQGRANEAWEKLLRSLNAKPSVTATTWLESQNSMVKELLENTLALADAQKKLQLAEINLAEAQGRISAPAAELRRMEVEQAFAEQESAERVGAARRMIENRRAAMEMARRESEAAEADARAAREAANRAAMEAAQKALQAEQVREAGPEVGRLEDVLMGTGMEMIGASYPRRLGREISTAHELQREIVQRQAQRYLERARRAEEAALAAEARAVEARGRLGGLSGGDEIGRLERSIQTMEARRGIERRAEGVTMEAQRTRDAAQERARAEAERQRRMMEALRSVGAELPRGADLRGLTEALREHIHEVRRLAETEGEVRRLTQELRRNSGGPNSRLP
jgi:hypothetical protein